MVDDNEVQQPEPETTPAPEPQQPLPLFDNDKPPVGPVDVDLAEGGDVAPVEAEPEPEPEQKAVPEQKPRPRGGNRQTAQERLNQATYEKHEALRVLEAERAERAAERAQLEQQNRELAQRSVEIDASAFDSHDAQWRNEETNAEQALAAAHEKQDPALIAAATKRLTKAASEMQAINAWKAQRPDLFDANGNRRQIQQQRQQPVYQQPAAPQPQGQPQQQFVPPPEFQDWIQQNPWINGNAPEFDRDMAEAATTYTQALDARYHRAGRSAEIGGASYLQDLDGFLQREFPDAYQGPAPTPTPRRPTMTRPNGAGVAPASRQSPTPMNGQNGSNSVRLSSEEHDFALIQTRNGAYKYPVGHPKQGQRMSDADGVRYHAQFVQRDRDQEPMRGKR